MAVEKKVAETKENRGRLLKYCYCLVPLPLLTSTVEVNMRIEMPSRTNWANKVPLPLLTSTVEVNQKIRSSSQY